MRPLIQIETKDMNHTDFIKRNARFRVTFWDLFYIGIILFGVIALEFVFYSIFDSKLNKDIFFFSSIVIIILCVVFFLNKVLNTISFKLFYNNSKKTIDSIIADISVDFNLNLYKQDNNTYKMVYFLPTYFKLFKIKRVITIIPINNGILINIRNLDPTKTMNFVRDTISNKILISLEKK